MKTSELVGPALDLAVAKAWQSVSPAAYLLTTHAKGGFRPSTDWAQGGPMIEREGIRIHRSLTGNWWAGSEAQPSRPLEGPTPLIAAMRCYVANQLGDEIDIPPEIA